MKQDLMTLASAYECNHTHLKAGCMHKKVRSLVSTNTYRVDLNEKIPKTLSQVQE